MSLYVHGIIANCKQHNDCPALIKDLGNRHSMCVTFDLETDDRVPLANALNLPSVADACCFKVSDDSNAPDATHCWIEAMNCAREHLANQFDDLTSIENSDIRSVEFDESYFDAMLRTQLGGFLSEFVTLFDKQQRGISIFDGSPETEIKLADNCVREILKTMILTWDCLPNSIYTW